jgi:hypothetical protein
MGKTITNRGEADGTAALLLMEEALALLDQADFPGEVGADLDHAICRLRGILGISVADGSDASAVAPGSFGEAAIDGPADPS